MKRKAISLVLCLLLALSGTGFWMLPARAEEANGGWLEGYRQVILNVEESVEKDLGPKDGWYFELIDLDGNGVPELVCVSTVGARLISSDVVVYTWEGVLRELPVSVSTSFGWDGCFQGYRSWEDGSVHYLMNLESFRQELLPGRYLESSGGQGGVAEISMDPASGQVSIEPLLDVRRDYGIEPIYGGEAYTKDSWEEGCLTEESAAELQDFAWNYEPLDRSCSVYFSRYELLSPDESTYLSAATYTFLYDWYYEPVEGPSGPYEEAEQEPVQDHDFPEDVTVMLPYRDFEIPLVFSEKVFYENPYEYHHDLAFLSLCMEISAWTEDEYNGWGEDVADDDPLAERRSARIRGFFELLGFSDISCRYYGKSLNATVDKAAYTIACKPLSTGETLIAVAVRGLGYGAEWSSNFHLETEGPYHTGFNEAAYVIYRDVLQTVKEAGTGVKIWISGYSRGAAIANLLAAELVDLSLGSSVRWPEDTGGVPMDAFQAEDIFTYTFATPQGVTKKANPHALRYASIYNIVNPGDAVPNVAPAGWGFTRFGTTREFNTSLDEDTLRVVGRAYTLFTGDYMDAKAILQQQAAIRALMNILVRWYPSREDAWGLLLVLRNFLEFTNNRKPPLEDDGDGDWVPITVDDYYGILFSRYEGDFIEAWQFSQGFLNYTSDGRLLMQMVTDPETQELLDLFFLLCELNAVPEEEVMGLVADLLSEEGIGDVLDILLNLPAGIGGVKTAHEIEDYLAWMSLGEEVLR